MIVGEPNQMTKNPANSSPLGLLGHTKATPVNQDDQQAPSPLPPFHKEFHTFTTQPLLLNPPERPIETEVYDDIFVNQGEVAGGAITTTTAPSVS